MKLMWTKTDDGWFGVYGRIRAEIRKPAPPLGFYHWSVRAGAKKGASGGTSSIAISKREAEREVERFAAWLRSQEKVS